MILADGSGYVEDGREIFDDDLDAESIAAASSSAKKDRKRKKGVTDHNTSKGNLQFMISNMQSKKKKEEVKLDEDDILSELISEIDNSDSHNSISKPPLKKVSEKEATRDYLKSFSVSNEKPPAKPLVKSPIRQKITSKPQSILKEIKLNLTHIAAIEKETKHSTIQNETLETSSHQIKEGENMEKEDTQEQKDHDSDDEMYANIDVSGIEEFDKEFDEPENTKEATKEIEIDITEKQLIQGWENLQKAVEVDVPQDTAIDTSSLPTVLNKDNQKVGSNITKFRCNQYFYSK